MIKVSSNFDAMLARLDKMAADTAKASRVSAKAGADVLYKEVLARVPVSDRAHSTKGKKQTYQPGNLRRAIYRAFMDKDSNRTHASYRISWNRSKAFYGLFVENEFGSSKRPATPFLRPSYDAKESEALRAANKAFIESLGGSRK